uniref:Uncharacterized protein n=1 Tax=Panagrolaimus superbus TaxID=310955 RepID=A0A914Y7E7_9BILA
MAGFVDCDFCETDADNELESGDMFDDEPPAKKQRGANVKYDYVEAAESFDDLKAGPQIDSNMNIIFKLRLCLNEKAKTAGLTRGCNYQFRINSNVVFYEVGLTTAVLLAEENCAKVESFKTFAISLR